MAPPTPVLFIGDNPTLPTGLARIGRDLATLLSSMGEFRVAYLGRGGTASNQLPFTLYPFNELDQWGEEWLPSVWMDFAPHERGIVFSTWDITRLTWLGMPQTLPECPTREIIESGRFKKWGYFPIDSTGPGDQLTHLSKHTLSGFDRILVPTRWAKGVVERSVEGGDVDWMPHGLNLKVWTVRDRLECRREMGRFMDGDRVIGVVATNQARKDWGLTAQICRRLAEEVKDVRFWWHVDVLQRHWSIPALLADFGLGAITQVTTSQENDKWLAGMYGACDLTIHPGLGEGFGYPIAESLACGVPAVHGNYGGGAELTKWRVEPKTYRLDTLHNCTRPVFEADDWVGKVNEILADPPRGEDCRGMVEHLSWQKLWKGAWRRWFLRGIR